ncbi:MAG TPA: SIS domain-containing protein [bacterium]|nr:SIS domain-containing protein [bacterium]
MAGIPNDPHADSLEEQIAEISRIGRHLTGRIQDLMRIAVVWAQALESGNKIMFCGNGGSAATCQHLAGELVGRFQKDRKSLAGLSLTADTSVITAIANDYGYRKVFARQLVAQGRPGDILVGISTSGESKNVVAAFQRAKQLSIVPMALTGLRGNLRNLTDYAICVPSNNTQRIQEAHLIVGHILCGLVEDIIVRASSQSIGISVR